MYASNSIVLLWRTIIRSLLRHVLVLQFPLYDTSKKASCWRWKTWISFTYILIVLNTARSDILPSNELFNLSLNQNISLHLYTRHTKLTKIYGITQKNVIFTCYIFILFAPNVVYPATVSRVNRKPFKGMYYIKTRKGLLLLFCSNVGIFDNAILFYNS